MIDHRTYLNRVTHRVSADALHLSICILTMLVVVVVVTVLGMIMARIPHTLTNGLNSVFT